MGLDARKPDLGVCNKVIFKQAYSATETSLKIEISLVASLDIITSNKRITKALIRSAQAGLRLCCSQTPKDRFSGVVAHVIMLLSATVVVGALGLMNF